MLLGCVKVKFLVHIMSIEFEGSENVSSVNTHVITESEMLFLYFDFNSMIQKRSSFKKVN
jgi:hypothetical protein